MAREDYVTPLNSAHHSRIFATEEIPQITRKFRTHFRQSDGEKARPRERRRVTADPQPCSASKSCGRPTARLLLPMAHHRLRVRCRWDCFLTSKDSHQS